MADIFFQGPAALTLDQKGRLAFPTRHRELLAATGELRLTVTRSPEGALLIYPRAAWETFRDQMMKWPITAIKWKRMYLGNAVDVELDASSRILIAPELREAAGLERNVMLLGMGPHLELWDAQRYAAADAEAMNSPMPDELKSFAF